jgi:hypothetical protein
MKKEQEEMAPTVFVTAVQPWQVYETSGDAYF